MSFFFPPLSTNRATTHSCPHSSLRKNSVQNIIKGQARHLFLNPLAGTKLRWGQSWTNVFVRKRQTETGRGVLCFQEPLCFLLCFLFHPVVLWAWWAYHSTTNNKPHSHCTATWHTNLWRKINSHISLTLVRRYLLRDYLSAHNSLSSFTFLSSVSVIGILSNLSCSCPYARSLSNPLVHHGLVWTYLHSLVSA